MFVFVCVWCTYQRACWVVPCVNRLAVWWRGWLGLCCVRLDGGTADHSALHPAPSAHTAATKGMAVVGAVRLLQTSSPTVCNFVQVDNRAAIQKMARVVGGGCRRGGPAPMSPTWLALGFVGAFVLSTCLASGTPSTDRVVLSPSDGLSHTLGQGHRQPITTGHHYNHPHAEVSEISCVFAVSFCGCHIGFGAIARLLMVLDEVCIHWMCEMK